MPGTQRASSLATEIVEDLLQASHDYETFGAGRRDFRNIYLAEREKVISLVAALEYIASGDGYYPDIARTALYGGQCNHWPGQKRCGVCGMGEEG